MEDARKIRRRLRERLAREKIRNDPKLLAARRERDRERWHKNAQRAKASRNARMAVDAAYAKKRRAKRSADKRRYRKLNNAKGLSGRGTPLLPREDSRERTARTTQLRVEIDARKSWREWIYRSAPYAWRRKYWRIRCRLEGRPWGNPTLTDAQQYRIRYWLHPLFRAREYERLQRAKEVRGALVSAGADGTLTAEVIMRLFAEAKHCCYCGQRMRSTDKSLDHMTPLKKGGKHSIYNALICCKSCNSAKGARSLGEWFCPLYGGALD